MMSAAALTDPNLDYQDFVFEEDPHRYVTANGIVCPSITQMMSAVGIYDFSKVPKDILENAKRRGKNVHRWCAEFDRHGWVDETWMEDDERPYLSAWIKFRHESKFVVRSVEVPMLRPINGVLVGGTPDVIGFLGPTLTTIERKACRAKHPGWGVQTALQEMLITGKPRIGHMERIAVQLKPDGTYSVQPHTDATDGDCALAIVQKFGAEEAIQSWKSNHGLRAA
jgi:hypothetical protein